MSEKRVHAVFVISVAAELSGMHPQTLRIYERKGLIDPYRTPGGTRRYSQEDIERLTLIQTLTSQGLNLEGVKQVLDLQTEVQRLRADVTELRRAMEETRRAAERQVVEIHQSYRRDIVLRSQMLPEQRRRPEGSRPEGIRPEGMRPEGMRPEGMRPEGKGRPPQSGF